MTTPQSEVMTAMPTRDALDQANLQAMRTMGDQVAMVSRLVTGMASDLKETRDAVLKLEAQELKATMLSIRTEALATVQRLREEHDADIAKLREDHDTDIEKVGGKAEANARAISRIQGIFLPISIAVTALLAFFGELAANAMNAGPPHHP